MQDHPGVAAYEHKRAISYLNLGVFHAERGRANQAEAYLQKALAVCEKLCREQPDVPEYEKELAESHTNLGNLYLSTSRAAEAEAAYRKGLAPLEHLAHTHPTVPNYQNMLAAAHNNLGLLLAATQHPVEAKAAFQKAIDLREALIRDYPHVSDFAVDLGGSYANMANLVRDTGDPRAALEWYTRSLRTLEAQLQKQPRDKVVRQRRARTRTWGGRKRTVVWRGTPRRCRIGTERSQRTTDRVATSSSCTGRSPWPVPATTGRPRPRPRNSRKSRRFRVCSFTMPPVFIRFRQQALAGMISCLRPRPPTRRSGTLLARSSCWRKPKRQAISRSRLRWKSCTKDPDLVPISVRDDFKKWLAALEAKVKGGRK